MGIDDVQRNEEQFLFLCNQARSEFETWLGRASLLVLIEYEKVGPQDFEEAVDAICNEYFNLVLEYKPLISKIALLGLADNIEKQFLDVYELLYGIICSAKYFQNEETRFYLFDDKKFIQRINQIELGFLAASIFLNNQELAKITFIAFASSLVYFMLNINGKKDSYLSPLRSYIEKLKES